MKSILIPIAEGFEEIEAVTLIDILRRADLNVIVSAVDESLKIKGAHNIVILCDDYISNATVENIDMILLPGGWGGTKILASNNQVQELLKQMNNKHKDIAAICAAPYALDKAGVLPDNFTCYPSVEDDINTKGYTNSQKIVEQGNVITSQGPATAMCLALYIVKKYTNEKIYNKIKAGILADFC